VNMSISGLLILGKLASDLQSAAKGIADEALIMRGAGWIAQLEREYPTAHRLLMSALYEEPRDVLQALSKLDPQLRELRNNEHALEYVRQLQKRIRGESK
jgi:hypothetical protein